MIIKPINSKEIIFDKTKIREESVTSIIESLNNSPLLHPITVFECNNTIRLITGVQRLEAHIRLNLDIDCLVIDEEVTPDRAVELGLIENLKRAQLPWPEEVQLKAEYHNMQQRKIGPAQPGRQEGKKKGWGLRDSADALNVSTGQLSMDLQLANALIEDAGLKNVKDKVTAFKLIKEQEKRMYQKMDASVFSRRENQFLHGESNEIVSRLEAETFGACITDPPWIDFREKNLRKDDLTLGVFEQVYRVLRKNAFLLMFVGTKDFYFYQQELPHFGYIVQEYPCVWAKSGVMSYGVKSWEYGRCHELILLAVKGKPALVTHKQKSSVFLYPALHSSKLIHPNEKPIELMKNIIKDTVFENDSIIDPFAGSGSSLEAAHLLGVKYVGIERDYTNFCKTRKRLEGLSKI